LAVPRYARNRNIGIGHRGRIESRVAFAAIRSRSAPVAGDVKVYLVLVWSRLHSLSFGPDRAAGWYASKSTLRLTDQATLSAFQSDVTKLETYARGIFSGYDDYGCAAQMGSLS